MVCLSYWLYNNFMNNLIVLNKNDNVGVSQFIIPEKTKIEGHEISTIDPIPFGHKVCLKTIKKGDARPFKVAKNIKFLVFKIEVSIYFFQGEIGVGKSKSIDSL